MSEYFYSLESLLWICADRHNVVTMAGVIAGLATEENA